MIESLNQARERLRPHVESASRFTGWMDFPPTKLISDDLPWSYSQRVRELLPDSGTVLDIGTGGAERLASYLNGYSGRVVATEEWSTNVPVAAETLRPLGGAVVHCMDARQPFVDASFHLILDRHSELDPVDVARMLKPGGTVLTQQVNGDCWPELRSFFPRKTDNGDIFRRYRDGFAASGLRVRRAEEHDRVTAYESLGALVYMLCITPWTIPDFDPLGNDLQALLEAERALTTADGVVVTEGRMIIEAQKPMA
jgi:hypothetical protein